MATIGITLGALLYYFVFAVTTDVLHIDVVQLYGTWAVVPAIGYLPFVLTLSWLKISRLSRILAVFFITSLGIAVPMFGAWGMEGVEAEKSLFLPAYPLLSVIILVLVAAAPIPFRLKTSSGDR